MHTQMLSTRFYYTYAALAYCYCISNSLATMQVYITQLQYTHVTCVINATLASQTSLLQEEFEAIMLPKHDRHSSNLPPAGKHLLQHEALAHAALVPSTVSWVGTGGGGLVTDQAVCGSCWAFATAAALQGALWMKTGRALWRGSC